MTWTPELDLSSDESSTLRVRIADAIIEDIRSGKLTPGTRLPGTRTLGTRLGVDRSTVIAAYDELGAQGWVVSRERSGVFVADFEERLAERGGSGRSRAPGFEWEEVPNAPIHGELARGVLHMAGGLPDARLMPVTELARALPARAPTARIQTARVRRPARARSAQARDSDDAEAAQRPAYHSGRGSHQSWQPDGHRAHRPASGAARRRRCG